MMKKDKNHMPLSQLIAMKVLSADNLIDNFKCSSLYSDPSNFDRENLN